MYSNQCSKSQCCSWACGKSSVRVDVLTTIESLCRQITVGKTELCLLNAAKGTKLCDESKAKSINIHIFHTSTRSKRAIPGTSRVAAAAAELNTKSPVELLFLQRLKHN